MKQHSNPLTYAFIAIFLVGLGQLNNTLYIPSLPAMTQYFDVTPSLLQFSLTLSLIIFGIMQFVYGPLADLYGRRRIALIGIGIFCIGSVIALTAFSVTQLLVGRALQGLGVGCVGVVSRAVIRDVFIGPEFLRYNGYFTISMAVTPALSPFIGGMLQHYIGWRANFVLLACVAIGLICFIYFRQQETKPPHKDKRTLKNLVGDYLMIVSHPRFLGLVLCNMFAFSGEIAFALAASFILQNHLHVSASVFGSLLLLIVPFIMLGGYSVSLLSRHFNFKVTTGLGIMVSIIGSLTMLLVGYFHQLTIIGLIVPMIFYAIGEGMTTPGTSSGSLELFPHHAGMAGAVTGGLAMFGSGVITSVLKAFPLSSQVPLAYLLLMISALSLLSFYILVVKIGSHTQSN